MIIFKSVIPSPKFCISPTRKKIHTFLSFAPFQFKPYISSKSKMTTREELRQMARPNWQGEKGAKDEKSTEMFLDPRISAEISKSLICIHVHWDIQNIIACLQLCKRLRHEVDAKALLFLLLLKKTKRNSISLCFLFPKSRYVGYLLPLGYQAVWTCGRSTTSLRWFVQQDQRLVIWPQPQLPSEASLSNWLVKIVWCFRDSEKYTEMGAI